RLVVIGQCGVGKTALIKKFTKDEFIEEYKCTAKDSTEDSKLTLGLWTYTVKITNIGSEDAYRDNTIRDSNSFLLVYDTCNQSSLKKIPVLFPKIHEARVAIEGGSLNSTSIAPPLPSVVVVGTKSNRIDERKVTTKKGRMVAKGLDCEFCEVTAK
ncbi:P-loop containing nucleoside triphosphate hydrolase protein, partial [Trematosphaeria pertusa]